jgi:hypothetical protein
MNWWSWRKRQLTPRQSRVLLAVRDQQLATDPLLGRLGPWLLAGEPVEWTLASLVLRGMVAFDLDGEPWLTQTGASRLAGLDARAGAERGDRSAHRFIGSGGVA